MGEFSTFLWGREGMEDERELFWVFLKSRYKKFLPFYPKLHGIYLTWLF